VLFFVFVKEVLVDVENVVDEENFSELVVHHFLILQLGLLKSLTIALFARVEGVLTAENMSGEKFLKQDTILVLEIVYIVKVCELIEFSNIKIKCDG
jgi:hypothetical protein